MSDHLKKRKNAVLLRNINLQNSLRSLLQTLPLQANLISPILSLTALRRGWTMTGSVYHGSQILRASTAASQPRQWRVRFWFVVCHFENRMAGIQGTGARALVLMSGGFCALSWIDHNIGVQYQFSCAPKLARKWDWTIVFPWCGRAVYSHVITKFSGMGRFT